MLNRGSSTGTNKFGLLLALLDLAPFVDETNRSISFDALAEKLIELHWDHTRPFNCPSQSGALVLRQVTSGNRVLKVVSVISELRGKLDPALADASFLRARPKIDLHDWKHAVALIADYAELHPIPRLQKIDNAVHSFLYTYSERSLTLNPGVPTLLARFGPVLREMVEGRFVRQVVVSNPNLKHHAVEEHLRAHLFGAERPSVPMKVRQSTA